MLCEALGSTTPVICTGRAPEAKAERVIAEELERQGWQESELAARPKSDAVELLEMTQAMVCPLSSQRRQSLVDRSDRQK